MEDLRHFSFPSLENNKKITPTGTEFLLIIFKVVDLSSTNCLVNPVRLFAST